MRPRILIVEDNTDNRAIYSILLRHTGYTVLEAGDGEEGVRMATQDRPDLILMDISLPKLDGYAAARALKSDASTAGIPIIALTAHALAGEEQKAREAGCDGYLAKPVEPGRVVEAIERVLQSPPRTV